MKKLIVKYRYGKTPFLYRNASASMVNQVLNKIEDDLIPICGLYKWHLDYDKDFKGRQIIATAHGSRWVEATGKYPGDTLFNFLPARRILSEVYGINRDL